MILRPRLSAMFDSDLAHDRFLPPDSGLLSFAAESRFVFSLCLWLSVFCPLLPLCFWLLLPFPSLVCLSACLSCGCACVVCRVWTAMT